MKRVDFSNLNMEVRIGEYRRLDSRKELGNVLFSNANTLELDQLARKIFNAPKGEIEVSDQEYDLLIQTLQIGTVKYSVIEAIKSGIKDDLKTVKRKLK